MKRKVFPILKGNPPILGKTPSFVRFFETWGKAGKGRGGQLS